MPKAYVYTPDISTLERFRLTNTRVNLVHVLRSTISLNFRSEKPFLKSPIILNRPTLMECKNFVCDGKAIKVLEEKSNLFENLLKVLMIEYTRTEIEYLDSSDYFLEAAKKTDN